VSCLLMVHVMLGMSDGDLMGMELRQSI